MPQTRKGNQWYVDIKAHNRLKAMSYPAWLSAGFEQLKNNSMYLIH